MSYHADETYTIYHEQIRRAAKDHACSACKETIAHGHRYAYVFMLFEGKKEHLRRCMRCQALHEHLRSLCRGDDVWPDERLNCGRSYRDEWGDDPPPEVAAMAFKTGADMQDYQSEARSVVRERMDREARSRT